MSKTRIDCRLEIEDKQLIEHAASLLGQSVTDFMILNAKRLAKRIIQNETTTRLSERDYQRFIEIMDSDAEPNTALKRAWSKYSKNKAGR